MTTAIIHPQAADLEQILYLKHGDLVAAGWGPRARMHFNYFTPDEHYEAVVLRLITKDTSWLDVGCGKCVFPDNPALARVLSSSCKLLVGLDPDDTIEKNSIVHRKFKGYVEDFESDSLFDVITLRMSAEHIANPDAAVKVLANLVRIGGKVVIYTVEKWAIVPIATRLIPFRFHHAIKRVIWGSEEEDTFPVFYRMNTRKRLSELFSQVGLEEIYFAQLDDCRLFARFKVFHYVELSLRVILKTLRLTYPDRCILGIYEKLP